MTTQTGSDVITPATRAAFPAVDAHRIARITYRQLDHWARQGWVRPSLDSGQGRSGKRLYSADDVVRLDVLRHLAMSKVNAAVAGPAVASLSVPGDGDVRVLWGPVGRGDRAEPAVLRVVGAHDALSFLERGGAYVVYNPAAVRARMAALAPGEAEPASATTTPRRSTARRRTA